MLERIKPSVARALPGVEVDWFQAGTEKLVAKIASEMEAGKVGADVLMVADPSYYIFLKAFPMDWERLSTEMRPLKEQFTRVMNE